MSIVRDNGDECPTRVERMIEEFRNARARRLARVPAVSDGVKVMDSQNDAPAQTAIARSTTTSHPSH